MEVAAQPPRRDRQRERKRAETWRSRKGTPCAGMGGKQGSRADIEDNFGGSSPRAVRDAVSGPLKRRRGDNIWRASIPGCVVC